MAATKKSDREEGDRRTKRPGDAGEGGGIRQIRTGGAGNGRPPLRPRRSEGIPAPRGRTKEGLAYTKDFDVKFLKAQCDVADRARAASPARRSGSRTRPTR